MLTIQLICVGSLKENYLKQAIAEYSKRLGRFCKLNIVELPEWKAPKTLRESDILTMQQKESEAILQKSSGYLLLLDVVGQALTSEQLSEKLSEISQTNSTITMVIGGSHGVSEALKQQANFRLSFSKLTFPHQLMRVMALEQLYRAFTILGNIPYHK